MLRFMNYKVFFCRCIQNLCALRSTGDGAQDSRIVLNKTIVKKFILWYYIYMVLKIEDKILKSIKLTQEEAKLDFALGLYIDKRVTLGQAAVVASISQTQFLKELGKRQIPIHYDIEDFEKDLKTIETLKLHDSNK